MTEAAENRNASRAERSLASVEDLLLGSQLIHELRVPREILQPELEQDEDDGRAETGAGLVVKIRPLSVGMLALITRASRDEPSLAPLLTIKEAMVEPRLSFEQVKQMHVGLVHYLVSRINRASGLDADGGTLRASADSALGRTHVLLAKHFGWTPEQVSALTPGQVAVYLAGLERFLMQEEHAR